MKEANGSTKVSESIRRSALQWQNELQVKNNLKSKHPSQETENHPQFKRVNDFQQRRDSQRKNHSMLVQQAITKFSRYMTAFFIFNIVLVIAGTVLFWYISVK